MSVLDFTSSLYLGLQHPSAVLRPWPRITAGVPAALAAPHESAPIAHAVAALQGCETGTPGTSTLHLFWDFFGLLAQQRTSIYFDAGVYAIARWGIERAQGRGVKARSFAHHDAGSLRRTVAAAERNRGLPVVVTDGFCPGCGEPAPLDEYLACVRDDGGLLVVDDTQALGIFGEREDGHGPYGRGGGGMARWFGIAGPDVILISSLAKGFGAPLAVFSGSRKVVSEFEAKSETRVHCSPPSIAALRAAERALAINTRHGDRLRHRLAGLVQRFRRGVKKSGIASIDSTFPMQTLIPSSRREAMRWHQELERQGIRTVLREIPDRKELRVSFLIHARHTVEAIDCTITALRRL